MKQPTPSARWLRPFQIDVRALAAMRVMLGIVTLYDVFSRIGLLRAFYTDDGVSPRGLFLIGAQKWQSFFSISGSYRFALFLLIVHAMLALLFTIGYQTRIVSIALLASLWSLINRNPTLSHGGNNLEVWLLIWSIFVPLNTVASVDASTARPGPRFRRVASVATAAMLVQVAFVYWLAFAVKTNADWRSDFSAVYYFLNSHLATPLGYALGQMPMLSQLLTVGSLTLELFGPVFALLTFSMPRTRTIIVISFILFHLGLLATMYVGTFSFICIAAWLIYIPTPTWNAIGRWRGARAIAGSWNRSMARIARAIESAMPALAVRTISPGLQRPVAQIAAALLLVYVCVVNLIGTLPAPIVPLAGPLLKLPKFKQNWAMMDVPWRYFHALSLEVKLADGTVHTLTPADAPDGSFDHTLPTTHKPDEYWKWPVWRAENTWLVAYRSTLLLGAREKRMQWIAAYTDFHRRKWNQFHPSPGQQVKSIKVYALVFMTKSPTGAPNTAAKDGRQLLYEWPPK